ncbi:MAG: type II toxin-antitoxin system ParD family antitoxin [Pseudomonadota bacterium]
MAKETSVTVGEDFTDFIQQKVAEGSYQSATEVVHAGLRLLEEEEAKVAALRTALIEGEESGPARPFDPEAFLRRLHEEHALKK